MKISFIFFSVVALLFSSTSVFALDETKIRAARDACMKARENKTESSITEYVCPSGDVWKESQRPITKETICGSIAIQLTFEEIDKDAEKWMKKLQDTRNPNIISWTDEIYKKVRTTDSVGTGFVDRYTSTCRVDNFAKVCATTTDFFPETSCRDRAEKKAQAWENMGYILASRGVAKSFQNGKDVYMDTTKTAYDGILKKWSIYKRIYGNGVSKFTAYIRNAVK